MQRTTGVVIAAAVTILTMTMFGCGDSPQVKLEQARLAMQNDKPALAVELLDDVLAQQPNDVEALQLRARARLRGGELDLARRDVDRLLKLEPESEQAHRLLVRWAGQTMVRCLDNSNFASSQQIQQRYDRALADARQQADWMISNGLAEVEGRYSHGRMDEIEIQRLRMQLAQLNRGMETIRIEAGPAAEQQNKIDAVTAQIEQMQASAVENYTKAIALNPAHEDALWRWTALQEQADAWTPIYAFTQNLKPDAVIPAQAAGRLVIALLRMPNAVQPQADRLAAARRVLEATPEDQRQARSYLVAQARVHVTEDDFDKAASLLREALKGEPNNINANYLLAHCLYEQKRYEDARQRLDRIRDRTRDPNVHALLGQTLVQLENPREARDAFRDALDADPNHRVARVGFLQVLTELGFGDQMTSEIEQFYTHDPADPQALQFKIKLELARQNIDAARQVLEKAEAIQPKLAQHHGVLAEGWLAIRQPARAHAHAVRFVEIQPDSLEGQLLLARSLAALGQRNEARQVLEEAAQKFPDDPQPRRLMARLQIIRQRFDAAIDQLQAVVDKSPDNLDARLELAEALMYRGLVTDAVTHVEFVLARKPDDSRAHVLAARLNQMLGRDAEAASHYAQVDPTRLDPIDDAPTIVRLLLLQNQTDAAMQRAVAALEAGADSPQMRRLAASLYAQRGDTQAAENQIQRMLADAPEYAEGYQFAIRYYKSAAGPSGPQRGLTFFESLRPANLTAAALIRLAQADLLRTAGGQQGTQLAVERLQPIYDQLLARSHPMAIRYADALATFAIQDQDIPRAKAIYHRMIDADLRTPLVKLRLIDLDRPALTVDQYVQRLQDFGQQLAPGDRQLRQQVIERLAATGRLDPAVQMVEHWLQREPDAVGVLELAARLYLQQSRVDQAIQTLDHAVTVDPGNVQLRLLLGGAYENASDFPAAETIYRDLASLSRGAGQLGMASLGRMLMSLGLERDALAVYQELEAQGRPNDPRILLAAGQAYALVGLDAQASERLQRVPDFSPLYARAQIAIARIEQTAGKTDEAVQRMTALASNPQHRQAALTELLTSYAQHPEVRTLVEAADRVASDAAMPPDLALAWLRQRVAMADRRGDWQAAADALDQLVKLPAPYNGGVLVQAARIAVRLHMEEPQQARIRLNQLSDDAKQSPWIRMLMASAGQPATTPIAQGLTGWLEALVRGDADLARQSLNTLEPWQIIFPADLAEHLQRTDAVSPIYRTAAARLASALLASEVGLTHLAEAQADRVIAAIPSFAPAYAVKARALIKRRDPIEPLVAPTRENVPGSSIAMYIQSRSYAARGDFDKAVPLMEQLAQREPDHAWTQYRLAVDYNGAGMYDKAIAQCERIADKPGPYQAAARNDRAYLMAVHHPDKIDAAADLSAAALAAAPGQGPVLDTRGWIEHLRGNNDAALRYLQQAVALTPGQAEIHYHLGVVYQALNQPQWAKRHFRAAADGDDSKPEVQDAKKRLAAG